MLFTFEEVGALLDDMVDELPRDFFSKLNGGVNLLPDLKVSPESRTPHDLYVLGEYKFDPLGLGRYINIYYGSFERINAHTSTEWQKSELKRILLHEFTHHIESLAGERGLEIKDHIKMEQYKGRRS